MSEGVEALIYHEENHACKRTHDLNADVFKRRIIRISKH